VWHWVSEEVGQWDGVQVRQWENERQWKSETGGAGGRGTVEQCGSGAVKL
jgi:hypothetical protein